MVRIARLLLTCLLVVGPAVAGEAVLKGVFPFDELPRKGSSQSATMSFAGQVVDGCELVELELNLAVAGHGNDVEFTAISAVRNAGRRDRTVSLSLEVDSGGYEPILLLVIEAIDAEEGEIEEDREKVTLPTALVRSATKKGAMLFVTMVVSD